MPQLYLQDEKQEQYSEEIQLALKNVLEACEKEDAFIRKRHIFEAKQNDL